MSSSKQNDFGEDVICPLDIGNYWVYVDSTVGFNQVEVDTTRLEIIGKLNIDFENQQIEVFLWNWYDMMTEESGEWSWLNRNGEEGLWSFGILNSVDTLLVKTLDIMYPIEIGQSWKCIQVYEGFKISDTLTVTCIGTKDQFITPAGTFTCHVYYYQIPAVVAAQRAWPMDKRPALKKGAALIDSQPDLYEFFLFLTPNIGYLGLFQKVNGVLVWKKMLIDYYVRE